MPPSRVYIYTHMYRYAQSEGSLAGGAAVAGGATPPPLEREGCESRGGRGCECDGLSQCGPGRPPSSTLAFRPDAPASFPRARALFPFFPLLRVRRSASRIAPRAHTAHASQGLGPPLLLLLPLSSFRARRRRSSFLPSFIPFCSFTVWLARCSRGTQARARKHGTGR